MGERGTQIGLKNITKNEKDSKANIPAQYEPNTDVWLKQGIEWQRRGGSNARGQKKKITAPANNNKSKQNHITTSMTNREAFDQR